MNDLSYQNFMTAPGKYLQDLLLDRKQKNPRYSSRGLAKSIGLSSGFISLLMSGKRNLSLEQRVTIAEKLGLTPYNGNFEGGPEISRALLNKIEHDRLLNFPYHFWILELSKTKNTEYSVSKIAKRLNLSELEVERAFSRLIEFGYLEIVPLKSGKRIFVRTKAPLIFDPFSSSEAFRRFHEQSLLKAAQEIVIDKKENISKRNFQTVFIATKAEKVKIAREMIKKFSDHLFEYLKDDEADEVYQWSTQLFSIEENKK